jgi:hypothetical protein
LKADRNRVQRDPRDDDERLPEDVLRRPEEAGRALGSAPECIWAEGAVVLVRLRHLPPG